MERINHIQAIAREMADQKGLEYNDLSLNQKDVLLNSAMHLINEL